MFIRFNKTKFFSTKKKNIERYDATHTATHSEKDKIGKDRYENK